MYLYGYNLLDKRKLYLSMLISHKISFTSCIQLVNSEYQLKLVLLMSSSSLTAPSGGFDGCMHRNALDWTDINWKLSHSGNLYILSQTSLQAFYILTCSRTTPAAWSMAPPTVWYRPEYRMKAQVSMAIMTTPNAQSHTRAKVDRPTKNNIPDRM